MTTYTKAEKKGIVKALTACKQYLCDGNPKVIGKYRSYICFALNLVEGLIPLKDINNAKNIINFRLGEFGSVSSWLKHNIKNCNLEDYPTIQAYRLRWVNELIREYSH